MYVCFYILLLFSCSLGCCICHSGYTGLSCEKVIFPFFKYVYYFITNVVSRQAVVNVVIVFRMHLPFWLHGSLL